LVGKKFFYLLDGFSGYNHIHIAPKDQDKTTFTCHWGTFAYRVFPFGICNTLATFQRAILSIFNDLISEGIEFYMDDFTPYGDNFDQALNNMEKVLEWCIATRLHMMMTEGVVLGYYISAYGIGVEPKKVEVILNLATPHTQTEVRSFLGALGYYRRFMEKISRTAAPLHALTGNVGFQWSDKCDVEFAGLKKLISTTPALRGPNWKIPFHISTDASDISIGVVLGQEEDKKPYSIYFISKNLTPAEINYTVIEKEFLVVIHAINKFHHYITGYPFILYIDHSIIKYLANKPITNGWVTRWLLLLQEFDITIKYRPGRENLVVDFLSRIPKIDDSLTIEDQFPDEHLFFITTKPLWYVDVENYLATGKLLAHISSRERKLIVQCSARFTWIDGYIFHTGSDLQIRGCIREDEIYDILKAEHDEPCGGHFEDRQTRHKILQMGYYWPSIFKDANKYV
jgi:hypothetical protein